MDGGKDFEDDEKMGADTAEAKAWPVQYSFVSIS
jgi:hypothetical protein